MTVKWWGHTFQQITPHSRVIIIHLISWHAPKLKDNICSNLQNRKLGTLHCDDLHEIDFNDSNLAMSGFKQSDTNLQSRSDHCIALRATFAFQGWKLAKGCTKAMQRLNPCQVISYVNQISGKSLAIISSRGQWNN